MAAKLRVGYFGIQGSFTYKTAIAYFGSSAELTSTPTFRDIFVRVDDGQVDFGVIPIENTLAGSIYENYDLLDEYNLFVTGEVTARVSHSLLVSSTVGADLSPEQIIKKLRKVYSHEKALEQCTVFFKQHPWIKSVAYMNTAEAAKLVGESSDIKLGAIADGGNAKLYNLRVIKTAIENNKHNFTRFLVISKDRSIPADANKCSLLIHLKHVSGSLNAVLELLSKMNCNLTKIESRPVQTHPFEYSFYLDFIFADSPAKLDKILSALKTKAQSIRVLGVYNDKRASSVGLPAGIGKVATSALHELGFNSLHDIADKTEKELLAIHGVGPKAIRLLKAAFTEQGIKAAIL